jgi:hypothetical protein
VSALGVGEYETSFLKSSRRNAKRFEFLCCWAAAAQKSKKTIKHKWPTRRGIVQPRAMAVAQDIRVRCGANEYAMRLYRLRELCSATPEMRRKRNNTLCFRARK